MIAFIEKLNSEVLRSIERIESRDTDVLKKSLEASRVLGEAFDRLKQYIIGYRFQNDDEEIKFFKEIKPRLFCRLIYYRKLYNIEMNRPVGSIEAQREYLDAHVRAINAYTQKRLDFIRYFRSGATHLDSLYFLRGQTDTEQYLETFYYELDPQFSTNADFKVAKILANDMLSVYLMGELESLESTNLRNCTAPQKLDTFGVFFMKYNYEIRLKAVKLVLEGGLSVREAGCHLGCGRSQVHLWVTLFERHGLAGLKLRHGSYSAEFKLSVLKHMHQNHLSLLETAVHFGIPGPFVIRQWERLYQNQGAEGLRRKPQRRRPAMSKSKTKKVKLKTTPHEELLKELEYLRAENAYLKKLQALVEERIVRESGKEPKPSKD